MRKLVFILILTLCSTLLEDHASAQDTWSSVAVKQPIKMEVLKPQDAKSTNPLPVIFYLENLAAPRTGTDSDDVIVHDFLSEGYLVVKLDYAHKPEARLPFINRDFLALRDQALHKTLLHGVDVDPARIFMVPSGSRLLRDVVFYHDPDRTLAMDIIYPTHPAKPIGTIIEFSCDNVNRMGSGSLVSCSDSILDAEATEGFAVAMADHPVKAPYKGIDPMPDCAWKIKAAVRTLRSEGVKLGFNGKIAPVGFSRGSGMALMLVTTKGMEEFEGHGESTNATSDVQGAIVMSGRFSYLDLLPKDHMLPRYATAWGDFTNHADVWKRAGAVDYLTGPTLPLFLTINCSEDADAQHQMALLRKRLADFGSDEIFMIDREPRGHKVTLVPDLQNAMDAYLKSRLN